MKDVTSLNVKCAYEFYIFATFFVNFVMQISISILNNAVPEDPFIISARYRIAYVQAC
jgi:hypothetical protein